MRTPHRQTPRTIVAFFSAFQQDNKDASAEHHLPTDASAYSFRHPRISELLQVYGVVDPLTVAAQTGTSLRMIERTYFKFIPSAMLEKLASLSDRNESRTVPAWSRPHTEARRTECL